MAESREQRPRERRQRKTQTQKALPRVITSGAKSSVPEQCVYRISDLLVLFIYNFMKWVVFSLQFIPGKRYQIWKRQSMCHPVMAQRQDVITGDRGEEKKVGSKDMFFLCIPSLPSGDRMARWLLMLPPSTLPSTHTPHTHTYIEIFACVCRMCKWGGPEGKVGQSQQNYALCPAAI